MGQQRCFGDLTQVEADGIIDEVGIEPLQHVEIALHVWLGLDLVGHLRLDFFGNIETLVDHATDDKLIYLVHSIGLN